MSDYIDRQAAKDWLLRWEGYIDKDTITRMQYRVIDIPSVEVEPVKHGQNISEKGFLCSVCGFGDFEGFHGYEPNYCPNCGAKMEPISASTENGQEVEE